MTRLGMPDRLIAHATRKEQLAEVGLDPAGIARSVRDAIWAAEAAEMEDDACRCYRRDIPLPGLRCDPAGTGIPALCRAASPPVLMMI